MVTAFDIDDTITRHPEFFSVISTALHDAGHTVLILTCRSADGRDETVAELEGYGIRYTELLMYDGGAANFFSWKGQVCRQRGVEVFFEDMQEVIRHVSDKTLCLMAIDREIHDLDKLCQ